MDQSQTVSQLYQTLQKLLGFHRQLLDVVRQERAALVNSDAKAIQEATFAKEGLIENIKQSESARLKVVATLSYMWKKPVADLTLPQIILEVQGTDRKTSEALRSTFNALTILIQRIREANLENQRLVEQGLVHIHNMKKNVLGEAVPHSNTYTPNGQRSGVTGGSRLISREA